MPIPGPGGTPPAGAPPSEPGAKPESPAKAPKSGYLVVGRIGATHGVRGDLKIHSYSGDFEHLRKLKEVELVAGAEPKLPRWERAKPGDAPFVGAPPSSIHKPAVQRSNLRLRVLRTEVGPGGLSMAFEGYESPEAARALIGMDIRVPREKASPLKKGQYYINDLVGLDLVLGPGVVGIGPTEGARPGSKVATIIGVIEGGADPWLESKLENGSTALVPFRKEFIGEVDLSAGSIELLAPWLFE